MQLDSIHKKRIQKKKFPVVDEARCVLCHQEISIDAKERLTSFESFVQSKLETEAIQAETFYKEAKQALPLAMVAHEIDTLLQAAGLATEPSWNEYIKTFWKSIENSRYALILDEAHGEAPCASEVKEAVNTLNEFKLALNNQCIQHENDAKAFDKLSIEKNKSELDSKKWIYQQINAINNEINRKKTIKEYEELKSYANSKKISLKSGEISEKSITQEYVKRFNSELKNLGANKIKVELIKTKTDKGRALHRLQLIGTRNKQILENILSEGERRIVALAAFLADLTEKPNNSPFIFDDPISSLDQFWEEKTIQRLVTLSETRQVIVFTHRLSFMGLLGEKASDAEMIHIRHEAWGAGESGDVPLYEKKPEPALNELLNTRLKQARNKLQTEGSDTYYPLAKAICSDFRILIERTIEYVLLGDVVQRHRRAINTVGKIHTLTKIEPQDCDFISELMTKYSRYEHSQSLDAPVELPDPDELESDIIQLIRWNSGFTKNPLPKIINTA